MKDKYGNILPKKKRNINYIRKLFKQVKLKVPSELDFNFLSFRQGFSHGRRFEKRQNTHEDEKDED